MERIAASLTPQLFLEYPYVQKDKAVPVQAMKAYEGSRGTSPLILNLINTRR
jgi:hypothetical protein